MQLVTASNIKFLMVLTPAAHEVVGVQLKFESFEDGILVSEATISAGPDRFFRLQQAHYATRTPEFLPTTPGALRPA